MTEPTTREILDRLEIQERELATLRAARAERPRRKGFLGGRLGRSLAVLTTALIIALVPLSIYAANTFTDLQSGSVHNGDIDTIYNLGITTGCVPDTNYCPTNNVTRQEMASFLARTASLNRLAFTSLPSASAAENLGAGPSRGYMTVTLTVPGRAGDTAMLVKVDFTGYAFARSTAVNTQTQGCPCLLRGEITVNGETAGGTPAVPAQIVTRTVVGATPMAIVNPGPAERTDFSGSRVFTLAPGQYTFTMSLVREMGTAENVGFGFGNMQAQVVAFAGTGARVTTQR
jgi:hypothetical protein